MSKLVDVAGASTAREEEFDCEQDPVDAIGQQCVKNAYMHFGQLLEENSIMTRNPSTTIDEEAILLAEDIYERTLDIISEKRYVIDEELVLQSDDDAGDEFKESEEGEEIQKLEAGDSPEYVPEKKMRKVAEYIPLDYKIKVINIVDLHPKWNLKTLQRKGCSRLKNMDDLRRWRANILSGGTMIDKYAIINSWTLDRFLEARELGQQVTTRNLRQWALAAASQFDNFEFKASESWVGKFKHEHRIRQRKITKFVTQSETVSIDDTLAAAAIFRKQARVLIPQYNPDFVINTGQTGCQYQSRFNNATHFYTAQYSIALAGKLLPFVFVCLQESTGSFRPRIQATVDEYTKKYKNVIVTSSRSGKLSTKLYIDFLNNVLKRYVNNEKFLLFIDSWGGQTNPQIYDDIFEDENGLPTCTLKVFSSRCTSLTQPCDVYFYRQVKNFIKKIQNYSDLVHEKREINSREDCIKIQSIVHHQLSSPIFKNMLHYAWYASKLCDDREIFLNVNAVCFSIDSLKMPCTCKKSSFIQCARCRVNFCFKCFYDNYHPGSCN